MGVDCGQEVAVWEAEREPAVLLGRKDGTVLEAWPFGRALAPRDVDEVGHVRVGGREAAV